MRFKIMFLGVPFTVVLFDFLFLLVDFYYRHRPINLNTYCTHTVKVVFHHAYYEIN